jgi:hypothetical protein
MNSTTQNFERLSIQNELKIRRRFLTCKKIAGDIRAYWAIIEDLETKFMECFEPSLYTQQYRASDNYDFTNDAIDGNSVDVDLMRNNFMNSIYAEVMGYRNAFNVLNKHLTEDLDMLRKMINKDTGNNNDYKHTNNKTWDDKLPEYTVDKDRINIQKKVQQFKSVVTPDKHTCDIRPASTTFNPSAARNTTSEKYTAIDRFIKESVEYSGDDGDDGEHEIITNIKL